MPPDGVGLHACIQANREHLFAEHVEPSSEPSGQSLMPLQNLATSTHRAEPLHAKRLGGQFLDWQYFSSLLSMQSSSPV